MPTSTCGSCTIAALREREFFIDNLLVRIHFIIVMIRWTGLAPWGFELMPTSTCGSCTTAVLASGYGAQPLSSGKGTPYMIAKAFALKMAQAKARIWQ